MQDICCPICTEDIADDDKDSVLKMPSCNHVIHSACFGKYVHHFILTKDMKDIDCPLCRNTLICQEKPMNHDQTVIFVRGEAVDNEGNDDTNTSATMCCCGVFLGMLASALWLAWNVHNIA